MPWLAAYVHAYPAVPTCVYACTAVSATVANTTTTSWPGWNGGGRLGRGLDTPHQT